MVLNTNPKLIFLCDIPPHPRFCRMGGKERGEISIFVFIIHSLMKFRTKGFSRVLNTSKANFFVFPLPPTPSGGRGRGGQSLEISVFIIF